MTLHPGAFLTILLAILSLRSSADPISPTMHHLRHGDQREWDDFAAKPESDHLSLTFSAHPNATEQTLSLRHRDLRHTWKLTLNDHPLATLPQDDNPMRTLIAIPPAALKEGPNTLQITCPTNSPEADDIMIGDIALLNLSRHDFLTQSSLDVTVTDAATSNPIPSRITIIDDHGDLIPLGIESDLTHAVRTGVVYTATGRATLRLPAGKYTLYAGRGFEWSIDTATLNLMPGQNPPAHLAIRREVDTTGYVAADTHIHTFTHSHHGDATLAERMITLAAEGIELPIATDHNVTIDYNAPARAAGVRQYFTPIIGDEVTTPSLGHFNVFPLKESSKPIDFRAPTWEKLFASIDQSAPDSIVVLNHARDTHGNFRPFDPARHISFTGEDLDSQHLRANAMEVLNSGATLNDPLLLYRDWMGCLNRGLRLTPVGASDSHDVTRFIVGQGRTYIRADDRDPAHIDINQACKAFKEGRVLVSYGLLVDMKVNGQFTPGDLATTTGDVSVEIKVCGPSWTRASVLQLYANGILVQQTTIDPNQAARPGLKFSIAWRLPKPSHDLYLTAVATGPGLNSPYWPGAKPYQRTSPHWEPYTFACTAPVYLDADGNGSFQSPFNYANQIVTNAHNNLPTILNALATYDASTAAQVASILHTNGRLKTPQDILSAAQQASPTIQAAFKSFAQCLPGNQQ
jgi:hypothetical protein